MLCSYGLVYLNTSCMVDPFSLNMVKGGCLSEKWKNYHNFLYL